jgi:hypothetical protein
VNYEKDYYAYVAYVKTLGRTKSSLPRSILHHVVPLYAGGTDDPSNLVLLTPREHVLAHYLLVKLSTEALRYKAMCALRFFAMGYEKRFGLTNEERRTFHASFVRKYVDEALEENHRRNVGRKMDRAFCDKQKAIQSNRGPEWRRHIAEAKLGEKNPMYGKDTWMKGKKHSEESKKKQSESAMDRRYLWVSPDGVVERHRVSEAPSGWKRIRPDGSLWPT